MVNACSNYYCPFACYFLGNINTNLHFHYVTSSFLNVEMQGLVGLLPHRRQWPLQWRHNESDDILSHQPHDCLLKRLFRRRSKKTSNIRVTGLCAGNSAGTGEFPAQMASNTENVPFDDVIMDPFILGCHDNIRWLLQGPISSAATLLTLLSRNIPFLEM